VRKAINENPMVQIAVLGVAAVIFAFILFTSVLKKDDGATATPTDPAAATATDPAPGGATADGVAPGGSTAAPDTAVSGSAATPPADSTAAAPPTPAPSGGGSVADGLLPSQGLPKDVLVAFAKNKTIALLVIDPNGTSDKQVKTYTEALKKRGDVEVFIVDVKDISKYSRITAGVSVSRVPALVVVRPRKLTGSVPTATVSYGFRGARSVNTAIDDALYKGKQIPSYPADRKSNNKNKK
jgi:hypothetical protein